MAGSNGITAVVLVGGLGTRLRPLTLHVPKPLIRVSGKPFLGYLLSKLRSMGIGRCILLTGYKHSKVKEYCGSGKKWGLSVRYSKEGEPLGTGGAIYNARRQIDSTSLVLNGDSWLDISLAPFAAFHRKSGAWATIFSMRGDLAARGAIVQGKGGRVRQFLEKQKGGRGIFNTGAYLIEPAALEFLEGEVRAGRLQPKFSMERDGFPLIAKKRKLYSYVGKGDFLDIGTFSSLVGAHRILPAHEGAGARKRAVFLDRDGVINRHSHDYVRHPDDFEFEYGAIDGMKQLSKLGMPIIIATNQSMIGRGLSTPTDLKRIHNKMLAAFKKHKVKITDICICPHRPDEGCNCRKPKIGMLIAAQEKHNLDLAKSFVVGDTTGDILMGKTAGCTTILVKTGFGGKDGKHKAKPDYSCKDLPAAAKIIAKLSAKRK